MENAAAADVSPVTMNAVGSRLLALWHHAMADSLHPLVSKGSCFLAILSLYGSYLSNCVLANLFLQFLLQKNPAGTEAFC
jgi:hypothetical protein